MIRSLHDSRKVRIRYSCVILQCGRFHKEDKVCSAKPDRTAGDDGNLCIHFSIQHCDLIPDRDRHNCSGEGTAIGKAQSIRLCSREQHGRSCRNGKLLLALIDGEGILYALVVLIDLDDLRYTARDQVQIIFSYIHTHPSIVSM